MRGIEEDMDRDATMLRSTEGHNGNEGGTGREGHVMNMDLTGIKGLTMPCDPAACKNAADTDLVMVMVMVTMTREVAICVVATWARAPGVMVRLFLTRLTVALASSANMGEGVATERAMGMTHPRHLLLAIRGDDCRAVHEAGMRFMGHLAAEMGMMKEDSGTDLRGLYEVECTERQIEATKLAGYYLGSGGPTGCTCPICRAKEMRSCARVLLQGGARRGKTPSGGECRALDLNCWGSAMHRLRKDGQCR